MHEAGYAHRDVKPANVVWLPSDGSWHIIDFGCASRIGSRAPVTFSLTYAAPEVVAAAEINAELIEVFPEVDVWAFGVMAFELLTCVPAYRIRTEGVNKVRTPQPLDFLAQGTTFCSADGALPGVFSQML